MLEYHVYGPTDTQPTIVHESLIDEYLSKTFTTEHVRVKVYRLIDEMTLLYNGPASLPIPPKPANTPASEAVQITHIKKKG